MSLHGLIFKVTAGLKLSNVSNIDIFCMVSHALVNGLLLNLHRYITGTG